MRRLLAVLACIATLSAPALAGEKHRLVTWGSLDFPAEWPIYKANDLGHLNAEIVGISDSAAQMAALASGDVFGLATTERYFGCEAAGLDCLIAGVFFNETAYGVMANKGVGLLELGSQKVMANITLAVSKCSEDGDPTRMNLQTALIMNYIESANERLAAEGQPPIMLRCVGAEEAPAILEAAVASGKPALVMVPVGGQSKRIAAMASGATMAAVVPTPQFEALNGQYGELVRPGGFGLETMLPETVLVMKRSDYETPEGQAFARNVCKAYLGALEWVRSDQSAALKAIEADIVLNSGVTNPAPADQVAKEVHMLVSRAGTKDCTMPDSDFGALAKFFGVAEIKYDFAAVRTLAN